MLEQFKRKVRYHRYVSASDSLTVHAGERQRLCSKLLLHSYFQVKLDVIHVS